jgi:O-antigen/teichoic acid export membrane protein
MLNILLQKYSNSKGLLKFFFLTYLDKIISFALPLTILFILNDKILYNFTEVSFSYASLLLIVVELGVTNYLFYGYKQAEDKPKFLLEASKYFKLLLTVYFLLSILLSITVYFTHYQSFLLMSIILIRMLFTFYLGFQTNIYRLNDNPSGIYRVSIWVNVLSFILLVIASKFQFPNIVIWFFVIPFFLVTTITIRFLILEFSELNFSEFKKFLKNSLRFSWPIILNVLAMAFINNYAKIYAFANLSANEMSQLSFVMRVGLIVQMTHAAFSSYFSKSLFMDESKTINYRILKYYSFVILASALLVIGIIILTNYYFGEKLLVPISFSTFLFLLYIILWCFIGYFELYFAVNNSNRRVLFFSFISSLLYLILLKTTTDIGLLHLAVFMVISTSVNLLLVFIGLNQLKLFANK